MKILVSCGAFVVIFLPAVSVAQNVIQPDQCILKTLRGDAKQENTTMIRYNCVRQYIRSVEPKAISVPLKYFSESRIEWFPEMPGLPEPMPEHIIVRLKNDSRDQVIFADVVLADAKGNNPQSYRAYADYPIDPGTVGILRADVLTGTTGEKAAESFWSTHTWAFRAVYGVAAQQGASADRPTATRSGSG